MNETDSKLKEVCEDFIKRGNVYKLDGLEKFDQYFDEQIIGKFKDENNNISDELVIKLEHIRKIAKLFIFDIDPEPVEESKIELKD